MLGERGDAIVIGPEVVAEDVDEEPTALELVEALGQVDEGGLAPYPAELRVLDLPILDGCEKVELEVVTDFVRAKSGDGPPSLLVVASLQLFETLLPLGEVADQCSVVAAGLLAERLVVEFAAKVLGLVVPVEAPQDGALDGLGQAREPASGGSYWVRTQVMACQSSRSSSRCAAAPKRLR